MVYLDPLEAGSRPYVTQETLVWPNPDGALQPYEATVAFGNFDGRADVCDLTISVRWHQDRGWLAPPLGSKSLRGLRWGGMFAAARKSAQGWPDPYRRWAAHPRVQADPEFDLEGLAFLEKEATLIDRTFQGGGRPPRYDIDHWREVARVYSEVSRHPTKAVAEHFHVSRSTAGDWVAKCRKEGLLPPTRRGVVNQADPTSFDQGE